MNDKIFIDTNIIVYLATETGFKYEKIISELQKYMFAFVSVQVLNEFINTCTKKRLLKPVEIEIAINEFEEKFNILPLEIGTVVKALEIRNKYGFSYYDCLIVSSAILNGCSILFTEDLQHNQIIEKDLVIINPFLL